MIQLSQAAAKEIKRLMSKQRQKVLFRLQISSGGCSGWFYNLAFDEITREGDRVYECAGIPVVIDADSLNYTHNLLLDYSEDLMGGGFRFHNPSAEQVCGCGHSFVPTEAGD